MILSFLRIFVFIAMLGPLVSEPRAAEPGAPRVTGLADLSLEQLMDIPVETVFGASKFEQKITRAPASVTIVTAAEIAAYGQRTLADVLRGVRGLYVADDGNYSFLGARGFLRPGDYNTRVLVLIDGHRMNDAIYDSSYFGHDNTIETDAIERVEVIRGPSSSIYGNSAFFGVVNVITKHGAQIDGTEATAELGSFGSHRSRVAYGSRFANGAEFSLSGTYFHSNGQPEIYYPEFDERLSANPRAADGGVARHADAESALNFSSNLTYRDFSLTALMSSRRKTVPTASFGTVFNDPRLQTTDQRGYVDFAFHHELRPDLRLLARAYYDLYSYRGNYPYDVATLPAPPEVVLNRDRAEGEWIGTEWQLTATVLERHTLITGVEFRENLEQEQSNYYDNDPLHPLVDDSRRSRTLGLYAQGEFALGPRVLLNAGVRYDHYFQSFGGTLNPRVGLIFNPRERTTLKLLYGQAFRAPNVYERFYFPNPFAELAPEKIHTYEIAAEHYFAQHHRIGVSVYRYNISDLITQAATPAGDIYFANLDRAEANGIEFSLEGKYSSGLHLRGSYAWQRATGGPTGAELTGSPRHLAKSGLMLPFSGGRYTAGLELQYRGTVRTLAGQTAPGFLIGNFTVTGRPFPAPIELSASVHNLFNTHRGSPGAEDHAQDVIPQAGRTLNFKATYKF